MERYIRVVFFLQQIVTELLKKYLESKYLPDDFQTFLLKQRHSLFHLYIQKPCCACGNNINLSRTRVINEVQFNKLYVSGNNVCSVRKRHSCIYSASSNVKVSELDITLTIAILKNCFTTSLTQQEKDWLDDIRKIRNEISHLTITNDISENDFNRMWLTLDNSTINLANVFQPKNSNDIKLRIQQLKKREVLASKNDCMECLQQILLWKSNDENMNENLKKILEQLERMEAPVAKTGLLAIQIQQSTFTYKYGSQVVIPCVITVSDSIITNVYWERYSNNGKIKIKNGDSRYQGITPTTPSLIINCVALEDAGVYMCHVENANGNHTSYPVTITVYGGPPAIQIQTNICTHTCGSQAIIPCTISSDSIITNVYWEKRSYNDTVIIKNGDSRYQGISPTSPSLIIRCVALNDAGIYICHVQNTAGTNTSSPVTLNVNGGLLNISITPVEAYITPGNRHTIQCTVFGKPMATSVEWRFTPNGGNEQTLNISAWDWKYTGGSTQNPSLTINNFQPIDAGSYVCYVSNDVGKYSCKHPSVLKYRQPLGVSVEPAEGNIIIGHNHTIQCTVTGIATATSIKWLFTPNGGNQQSLNIGGRDGKYTGGSTQNPSLTVNNFQPADGGSYVCCVSNASGKSYSYPTVLTCTKYVPMFEKKDFTSEATVIDASKTSPTSIGMAAKVPSTELIYQRSSPGQRDGNDVETDIYKCIDGMRISGKESRKTALSYSLLVYAALRGSISIGQEHSPEFTEIAQTINDSDHVLVSSIKKILDSKLVPRFLTKVDNLTYSPRDNVVVKSVIHSFGKKFKTCLLKFGSFDILFDHVRFREVNTNGDLLEVDSETLAKSFFWRIQKESAFLIGQFMGKLGKEIDCKTFDSFVNILRQGKGDINFYHMDSLLDGLTKKGTNFDVFRKLPTLYDAFKRKVDNYGNTIFHYIVALYSQNKEYKTYMQHFCEKRFVLLQLENCDRYTAIDFASLLGRKEVIEIVISGASFNRQEMTDRISKMVTRGEEKLQLPNAKVDNLIKISLNNVDQGSSFDYAEIIRLIGNDSNTEAVDDAVRILDTIGRNVPIAVSAISALIGIFR